MRSHREPGDHAFPVGTGHYVESGLSKHEYCSIHVLAALLSRADADVLGKVEKNIDTAKRYADILFNEQL